VEFRILGPLEVLDGDRPVEIAGSKRRAVLALLLLHANEVVRTEKLIDELWSEQPPRNASGALHNHVSRLRKALGPEVLARREWGYVLRADEESIDLRRFERLLAMAEPLPARERSGKLAEALQLWRGPALADLATEPGLETEIARLDELRLTTMERRIDADLEAGRNAALVGEIEALIAAHPLREHLRWQLILALYRAGRQAEALEVYRETRRVLTEELGLEPSPELRELEKAILRQDPAIAAAATVLSAASVEQSRHSTRRAAMLGLLGLGLLGLGVAIPYVLIGHKGARPSVRVASAAVSAVVSTAATTQSSQHATSAPPHVHVAKQTLRPRQSSRHVIRQSKRASVHHLATPATAAIAPGPAKATGVSATTTTRTHTQRSKSTPVTRPSRATATKRRIVTISDDFAGNQIDGTIWYQVHQGSGWTLSQNNGHLELVFPPGTGPGPPWNNYGGHVGTRCQFPGNFDARVDFTLVQWPAANGINAGVQAFFEPNNYDWAGAFRWNAYGEQYGGVEGRNSSGGSAALDDTTGTLRLVRRNGLITSYFLHKGRWLSLGSGFNRSPMVITVGAASTTTSPPVRPNQVAVDFDNFTVTAANPICPAGAEGSA
jgi:DNA-binding SARP family transcriptional activator